MELNCAVASSPLKKKHRIRLKRKLGITSMLSFDVFKFNFMFDIKNFGVSYEKNRPTSHKNSIKKICQKLMIDFFSV